MPQAFATKPDNLSLIPRAPKVEGKTQFSQVIP